MSNFFQISAEKVREIAAKSGTDKSTRDFERSLNEFVEAYNAPVDLKSEPLIELLGVEAVMVIQKKAFEMAEKNIPNDERIARINALIQTEFLSRLNEEKSEASKLEEAALKAAMSGDFDVDDTAAAWKFAQTTPMFAKIPKIKFLLSIQNSHYSSVRGGQMKGSIGNGLKKKCSTLRVVALTLSHALATKLFWLTPWSNGSVTLDLRGLITVTVTASHFRGCILGIIPSGGANIVVGTIRNGQIQQSGPSGSLISGSIFVWPVNLANPSLNNVQYFATSNWNGITLSISGWV